MSRTSQALDHLRGFVILMVLAFHSSMAYVVHQPASALSFDAEPGDWTAHPMIDSHRWVGFDLFGAFQFLHLMQLMCLLSGVFVWPSLVRKGAKIFLLDRFLRLGLPFVLGVYLLMPLAYFPVYLVGAVDPSWSAFWSHWTSLPFWPCGPLWFLAFLLALNVIVAALYWLAPSLGKFLRRASTYAGDHPQRFFIGLIVVSGLAYLPMATLFAPWTWVEYGPFAIQPGIVPQYAVFFFAGLVIGARGIDRGFLAADAWLSRRWLRWFLAVLAGFALWIAAAAMIVQGYDTIVLRLTRDAALVVFAASASLGMIAIFQRFASTHRPFLGRIAENAYGIYLFHYLFVIWTQYALLGADIPAIAKGPTVFAFTLALSFAIAASIGSAPAGARLIRGGRATMAEQASRPHPVARVARERPPRANTGEG